MIEDMPAWLSVPLITFLSLTALYKCYILPGYIKDKKDKDNGEESFN